MLTALSVGRNLFKVLQLSATDGMEGDGSEQKLTQGKKDRRKRGEVFNVTGRYQSGDILGPVYARCAIQMWFPACFDPTHMCPLLAQSQGKMTH